MNLNDVPATPVYTIIVSVAGTATVDGVPVPAPTNTLDDAREAALAEVRIKAAFHGRPVRAVAKEPGGAWPLLIDLDGSVTVLDTHPAPHPPTHPNPPPDPGTLITPPPGTAPAPQQLPPHEPSAGWAAPPPERHRARYAQLRAQEAQGDLIAAIITADHLENELAAEYGPRHPHTVNMLTTRAWLTLRRETDWPETTQLLMAAVNRRREAGAQPYTDTVQCARNAHAAWRRLAHDDPTCALRLAQELVALLEATANTDRAADVRRWRETRR